MPAYTRGVPGKISAVLLAAGESTRMGQLKALLPWEGRPLLRSQVDALLAAPIERLVVVLGYRRADLLPLLPSDSRLVAIENPGYASGKVSSVVAGVRAVSVDGHVLILGVDQPRPTLLIREVCGEHVRENNAITIAAYQGRRGHPVAFAPTLRSELLDLREETEGLRAVLRSHREKIVSVETGDPLAIVNVNTPEDYAAALRLNSTSSARAGNQ